MNTITALPTQTEVDEFLSSLFNSENQTSFHLTALTDYTIDHFNIDPDSAEEECEMAHGVTSPKTTHIEQFVHWGCIHLLARHVIKRTAPNEYQHINGPKPEYNSNAKLVGEAMVSVKILKDLKWEPERIMLELHQWSDEIIESAINHVFGNPKST
jgi:hypothetical protein